MAARVVAEGTVDDILANPDSLTGAYLSGRLQVDIPRERRTGNGKKLTIVGARENNLKNIKVNIPLGKFVCITGVSGSGKSTLMIEILYKALAAKLQGAHTQPGDYDRIDGIEYRGQDHQHRPVTHWAHPTLQPRHLHRPVRPDPHPVCRAAREQDARLQARALLVQRARRAL